MRLVTSLVSAASLLSLASVVAACGPNSELVSSTQVEATTGAHTETAGESTTTESAPPNAAESEEVLNPDGTLGRLIAGETGEVPNEVCDTEAEIGEPMVAELAIGEELGSSGSAGRTTPVRGSTQIIALHAEPAELRAALDHQLRRRLPAMRRCYEMLLRQDRALSATIEVSFTVALSGTIESTAPSQASPLANCVVNVVRRLRVSQESIEAPAQATLSVQFEPEP